MTTSYDVEEASVGQHPTYDSKGHQVWNPSVGIYHKPAAVKRESYGGIIGALQDVAVAGGFRTKAYPENFAGIISAIQDLTLSSSKPPVYPDVKPPGGIIIIDPNTGLPDWNVIEKPLDGDLWFDTRQGRLFVWVEDDWYQTNGADGLPIVTTEGRPPLTANIVPGQLWWDAYDSEMYIYDGTQDAGEPLWRLVTGQGKDAFQTTGTLPLVKATMQPRLESIQPTDILPLPIDLEQMNTQEDYNGWVFTALQALEQEFEEYDPVTIGIDPPPVPREGQLWYDTEALELSIYYEDDDRGQWVPTAHCL